MIGIYTNPYREKYSYIMAVSGDIDYFQGKEIIRYEELENV